MGLLQEPLEPPREPGWHLKTISLGTFLPFFLSPLFYCYCSSELSSSNSVNLQEIRLCFCCHFWSEKSSRGGGRSGGGGEGRGREEGREKWLPWAPHRASMQMNASSIKIAPAVTLYYNQIIGLRLLETGKGRRREEEEGEGVRHNLF